MKAHLPPARGPAEARLRPGRGPASPAEKKCMHNLQTSRRRARAGGARSQGRRSVECREGYRPRQGQAVSVSYFSPLKNSLRLLSPALSNDERMRALCERADTCTPPRPAPPRVPRPATATPSIPDAAHKSCTSPDGPPAQGRIRGGGRVATAQRVRCIGSVRVIKAHRHAHAHTRAETHAHAPRVLTEG